MFMYVRKNVYRVHELSTHANPCLRTIIGQLYNSLCFIVATTQPFHQSGVGKSEMAMGWVHPWVGLGWVRLSAHKVESIELVRWGKRAGLLPPM